MAERPRIVDFGLLQPLSVRDRLRGERMCVAAGKPLPSYTPTSVLRPWRREKRAEPLSLKANLLWLETGRPQAPRGEFPCRAISEMIAAYIGQSSIVLGVY